MGVAVKHNTQLCFRSVNYNRLGMNAFLRTLIAAGLAGGWKFSLHGLRSGSVGLHNASWRTLPRGWLDLVRNQARGEDHHMLLHATKAVEENFPREFAGQLAFLTGDSFFFGEPFGEMMSIFADDWREIVEVGKFSG